MEEEEEDLPLLYWNKYKDIHKDEIEYLKTIDFILNELSKLLSAFENSYKLLRINEKILPIENNKINDTIKLINKSMISFIDTNKVMIKNILVTSQDIIESIKYENILYDNVLLCSLTYDEEKNFMDKYKYSFNEKLGAIEDSIKSEIIRNKSKGKNAKIKIEKKEIDLAIKDFLKYKESVDLANEKREKFNIYQINLLKCQKEIIAKKADLYCTINKNFYNVVKMSNESCSMMLEKIQDKKNINKREFYKEILSRYVSKEKMDQEIELKFYNLKHKPYPTSKNITFEDIKEASHISEEIIKIMRKYLSENFPNCNLQIQEAEVCLPEIINQYFDTEIEMTDSVKDDIIKLLREDITIYPQILIFLSRNRSNSKLYKSETHMAFLSYIFNEILSISEKVRDYNATKNCILLSQTYYVKDEKTNKKEYLFEFIKNNRWLKNTNFWRTFISNNIKSELEKTILMINGPKIILDSIENIPKALLPKLQEILFSSLLPNISNMFELNIDKRIIVKIIDEFLDKYNFLDQQSINNLFALISKDSEKISQLRNQYKENPNLVIGGSMTGQILLWDIKSGRAVPEQKSPLGIGTLKDEKEKNNLHKFPVHCLGVIGKDKNIISISTDGVLCEWSLSNLSKPINKFDISLFKNDEQQEVLNEIGPLCIGVCQNNDSNEFIIGCDRNDIYNVSLYGKDYDILNSYSGSNGPIFCVCPHPLLAESNHDFSDLFLSCGADWSIKLWSKNIPDLPLISFNQSKDYVYSAKWHPINPFVFATGDGSGYIDLWDLNRDKEIPTFRYNLKNAINHIKQIFKNYCIFSAP